MAGLNFRRVLRRLARAAQQEVVERLLAGVTVHGSPVAPRVSSLAWVRGLGRRRLRRSVFGTVRQIERGVGVRTGSMLRAMMRTSVLRVRTAAGRMGFKIVPPPEVFARWFALNAGTSARQAPRPVGGLTDAFLAGAAGEVASDLADQVTGKIGRDLRGRA